MRNKCLMPFFDLKKDFWPKNSGKDARFMPETYTKDSKTLPIYCSLKMSSSMAVAYSLNAKAKKFQEDLNGKNNLRNIKRLKTSIAHFRQKFCLADFKTSILNLRQWYRLELRLTEKHSCVKGTMLLTSCRTEKDFAEQIAQYFRTRHVPIRREKSGELIESKNFNRFFGKL